MKWELSFGQRDHETATCTNIYVWESSRDCQWLLHLYSSTAAWRLSHVSMISCLRLMLTLMTNEVWKRKKKKKKKNACDSIQPYTIIFGFGKMFQQSYSSIGICKKRANKSFIRTIHVNLYIFQIIKVTMPSIHDGNECTNILRWSRFVRSLAALPTMNSRFVWKHTQRKAKLTFSFFVTHDR